MRPLHSRLQTFMMRTFSPVFAIGVAASWFAGNLADGVVPRPTRTALIVISCVICIWGVIVIVLGRRFSAVWLDNDVLEVGRGRTRRRIPLADVTKVEVIRGRPNSIRLRVGGASRDQDPIRFIPVDAGYFDGAGANTQKELKRLVSDSRRPAS